MRRILRQAMVPVLAAAAVAGTSVTAAPPEEARAFMAELRDRAVEQLTDQDVGAAEREQRFRRILSDSFDLPAIGRFVLAAHWRKTDEATREAFLAALESFAVQRFLPLFAQYEGQEITFGEVRTQGQGDDVVTVNSTISRATGAPIAVQWRVRDQDGAYRIVDIVTEGASMAVTLRSEYRSVLHANGGDVRDLAARIQNKAGRSEKSGG